MHRGRLVWLSGSVATLALASMACGDEKSDCPVHEAVHGPQGSAADFAHEPGDYPGYTLEAPAECNQGGVQGVWIGLAGKGHQVFGETSGGGCVPIDGGAPDAGCVGGRDGFMQELSTALDAAGVHGAEVSDRVPVAGWQCTSEMPSVRVGVYDWRDADAVYAPLAERVVAWDLAEYVGVELYGTRAYICGE